jgi:hypothetical protein
MLETTIECVPPLNVTHVSCKIRFNSLNYFFSSIGEL